MSRIELSDNEIIELIYSKLENMKCREYSGTFSINCPTRNKENRIQWINTFIENTEIDLVRVKRLFELYRIKKEDD